MAYNPKKKYLSPASALPEDVSGLTVVADTEGTGLDKLLDRPFMFQARINRKSYAMEWCPNVVRWINDNAPRMKTFVFHGAKHDYHQMINGGVDEDVLYNSNFFCTAVAEALLDEHRFTYNLDDLCFEFFEEHKRSEEMLRWLADYFNEPLNKNKLMAKIQYAPRNMVAYYGIGDIELGEKLYYHQLARIKQQELETVVALEMEVLKALAEIERRGAPVNQGQVPIVERGLITRQEELQQAIIDLVGWPVNPRSPNDMTRAFDILGLPISYKKKTGNPTFAKDILEQLHHPFIDALEESRGVKTMLDTFIYGSIGGHTTEAGRIHTNFNQVRNDTHGTGTGRLSSSDPNLQQVPKRDGALAPLVRGLFAAPKGKLWISNDWEQFEFRVFAHYTNDQDLIARYHRDPTTDFHQALSDTTGVPRPRAKRINLGLVFGMGEGKLAAEVGLPFTEETGRDGKVYLKAGPEAKALFDEYHGKFPGAKKFLTQASNVAKQRGFVKTILGRRIRFPGGKATHKAGGLVFQGTSADFMKAKTVELNREFRKTSTEFILIVHDEYCLLSPKGEAKRVSKRVKEITEDIPLLRVPILAGAGIGPNWWEASK